MIGSNERGAGQQLRPRSVSIAIALQSCTLLAPTVSRIDFFQNASLAMSRLLDLVYDAAGRIQCMSRSAAAQGVVEAPACQARTSSSSCAACVCVCVCACVGGLPKQGGNRTLTQQNVRHGTRQSLLPAPCHGLHRGTKGTVKKKGTVGRLLAKAVRVYRGTLHPNSPVHRVRLCRISLLKRPSFAFISALACPH
jgi:hypothetical protein